MALLIVFCLLSLDPRTLLATGIQSVEGICLDWVAENLYFTDFYHKTLSVMRLNHHASIRVLLKDLGSPRSVIVHPARG